MSRRWMWEELAGGTTVHELLWMLADGVGRSTCATLYLLAVCCAFAWVCVATLAGMRGWLLGQVVGRCIRGFVCAVVVVLGVGAFLCFGLSDVPSSSEGRWALLSVVAVGAGVLAGYGAMPRSWRGCLLNVFLGGGMLGAIGYMAVSLARQPGHLDDIHVLVRGFRDVVLSRGGAGGWVLDGAKLLALAAAFLAAGGGFVVLVLWALPVLWWVQTFLVGGGVFLLAIVWPVRERVFELVTGSGSWAAVGEAASAEGLAVVCVLVLFGLFLTCSMYVQRFVGESAASVAAAPGGLAAGHVVAAALRSAGATFRGIVTFTRVAPRAAGATRPPVRVARARGPGRDGS